jgi:hypothetical protein
MSSINIENLDSLGEERRSFLCNTDVKNGSRPNLSKIGVLVGFFAILIANLAISSSTFVNQKNMQKSQPYVSEDDHSLMSAHGDIVGTAAVLSKYESFIEIPDLDKMNMKEVQFTFGSGNDTMDFLFRPNSISKKSCNDASCTVQYIYTYYTSEGNIVQEGDKSYFENPSENLEKALTLYGGSETSSRKLWMDQHGNRKLFWWAFFSRVFVASTVSYASGYANQSGRNAANRNNRGY